MHSIQNSSMLLECSAFGLAAGLVSCSLNSCSHPSTGRNQIYRIFEGSYMQIVEATQQKHLCFRDFSQGLIEVSLFRKSAFTLIQISIGGYKITLAGEN